MMREEMVEKKSAGKKHPKWAYVAIAVFLLIVAFVIGILIGYFGRGPGPSSPGPSSPPPAVDEENLENKKEKLVEMINNEMKAARMRDNLRFLTEKPHNAGTDGNERLAAWIESTWKTNGFDNVKRYWYNVLLSYPDKKSPNRVSLLDRTGKPIFESKLTEPNLTPKTNTDDMISPFNAFSPSGDVEGELVYVNYAQEEDFLLLERNYTINVTGKIVIARYGKLYRGNKVKFATKFGAAGMILFSDPKDAAPFPTVPNYPDSWWLPPTGIQRGTILLSAGSSGDPQTPGYPSIDSAYRIPEDSLSLPKIPTHPIGYGDAAQLLSRLQGPIAPDHWKGSLKGITYRIGPKFNETGWKVRLHVSTTNKVVRTSNVIGFIKGSVDPDRYVLVGNHRDAWGFGAIDPSSGTAVLMEMSRVFGHLAKSGWRPKRTLVFCSWGAEEYGLMGSYEWVENFVTLLTQRAVAYVNIDIAVMGNYTIKPRALPVLYNVVYDAAKQVADPNNPKQTLFQDWRSKEPRSKANSSLPSIGSLGSGSDFDPFVSFAGIPSIDLSYWFDTNSSGVGFYPLYHSVYETIYGYEKFIDPEYKYALAVGQFVGEMLRQLAFEEVLPLDVQEYASSLTRLVEDFEKSYGEKLQKHGIDIGQLKSAARKFKESADDFGARRETLDLKNANEVRIYNDQMVLLERAFVDTASLPERPGVRHVVFAPSSKDAYSAATFPGLSDLLFNIDEVENSEKRYETVKQHYATVVFTVQTAAAILQPVTDF